MRLIHWAEIGTLLLIAWAFWPVLRQVVRDWHGS